ncbi:hypothetical protein GCM10027572_12190 [Flexivirga lutea]
MGSARKARGMRAAGIYAEVVVWLRWVIVLGWLAAVGASLILLPEPAAGGEMANFLPTHSPAMVAQQRSLKSFAVPLTTGTIVVLHKPTGLATATLADITLAATAVDQQLEGLHRPYPRDRVLGALPIIDPRDRRTALTYLYFDPSVSGPSQQRMAQAYAAHFRSDPGVQTFVTGVVPAQNAEAEYLADKITVVELATLALVTAIVAVTFGSAVAPLLALGSAALAYLADQRLLSWLARQSGVSVPSELSPLIVALLLGVLTDYSVFFLSGFQQRLRAGARSREAVRSTITLNAPIIAVAGLTVAAGCGALYAAPTRMFSSFGPALAVTVLVGVATALTVIPAVMAIVGPYLFWPSGTGRPSGRRHTSAETSLGDRQTSLPVRMVRSRLRAAATALLCCTGLIAMAWPVTGLRLSLSTTGVLPASNPVQQGIRAMTVTFPRGSSSPTELLVDGPDLAGQRRALAAFQRAVAAQPGVAAVLGPADDPVPGAHGVVFSSATGTARLAVIYDSDPLGARSTHTLRNLTADDDALARQAGLRHVRFSYAGETALASDMARLTFRNLAVIMGAAILVEFLLLASYLRALVASAYLLACSVLTVAAALGLTVLVFQHWLHAPGLTFYVPFASAVLLLALGSDYNVFGIGRIWQAAADHPLREAIAIALPRSTRAITAAGLTLAGSFALVALVPLRTFAELAFAMGVGLLVDTFIVRSLLTPALLSLIGPVSGWPGHRLRAARTPGSRS